MARRRRQHETDGPGQDSFLDIVANIVGILIILVAVLGVQAKDAFDRAPIAEQATGDLPTANKAAKTDAPDDKESAEGEPAQALAKAKQQAAGVEEKVNELTARLRADQAIVKQRAAERKLLLTAVTARQTLLKQERDKLSDAGRSKFDAENKLAKAEEELRRLQLARKAVENQKQSPEVIKHLPTPLARTVFGDEVHFRLLGGRLAHVPMQELVERIKGEWEERLPKLRNREKVTETLGPVDGFFVKYTISRSKVTINTRFGPAARERVGVKYMELVPTHDRLGEPVGAALQPGSEFLRRLSKLDPNRATVTIWTYPDSFADFRRVKEELFRRGFLIAGRPLPQGYPISGSSEGTRSSAQ